MNENNEKIIRSRELGSQSTEAKRTYVAPAIEEDEVFERIVMGCDVISTEGCHQGVSNPPSGWV
ncbi:MAG: hypothetical protein ABI333_28145 [bacterium]